MFEENSEKALNIKLVMIEKKYLMKSLFQNKLLSNKCFSLNIIKHGFCR